MAQEQLVLRRIDWNETFAFTRLFGGFRSAQHSTKIVLALAGLFLTFFAGCLLDSIWVHSGQGVWPTEVRSYYAASNSGAFREWSAREYQVQVALLAQQYNPAITPSWIRSRSVQAALDDVRARILAKPTTAADQTSRATALQQVAALEPVGPFMGFIKFESGQIGNMILAAAQFRFTDGLNQVISAHSMGQASLGLEHPGVLGSIVLMWSGLVWLLREHWFFALLFVPIALAIWAVAGGGICRAAYPAIRQG